MGIFQGLAGNMQQMDPQQAQAEYAPWLLPGEQIHNAFRMLRDGFCITNLRIITLGISGKRAGDTFDLNGTTQSITSVQ